jgi:hypothetical protein
MDHNPYPFLGSSSSTTQSYLGNILPSLPSAHVAKEEQKNTDKKPSITTINEFEDAKYFSSAAKMVSILVARPGAACEVTALSTKMAQKPKWASVVKKDNLAPFFWTQQELFRVFVGLTFKTPVITKDKDNQFKVRSKTLK